MRAVGIGTHHTRLRERPLCAGGGGSFGGGGSKKFASLLAELFFQKKCCVHFFPVMFSDGRSVKVREGAKKKEQVGIINPVCYVGGLMGSSSSKA